MTFSKQKTPYQFVWCCHLSLEEFSNLQFPVDTAVIRACFITTQRSRIYLVRTGSGVKCVPYTNLENVWKPVDHRRCKCTTPSQADLESLEALKSFLEKQMRLQFIDTASGYFEDMLSKNEILLSLGEGATTSTLERLHYSFYEAEVQSDPEWDGAVRVYCQEGMWLFPYKTRDDSSERDLLLHYATFVPDNRVVMTLSKVGQTISSLCSRVSGVHWSDFRFKTEKLWR